MSNCINAVTAGNTKSVNCKLNFGKMQEIAGKKHC